MEMVRKGWFAPKCSELEHAAESAVTRRFAHDVRERLLKLYAERYEQGRSIFTGELLAAHERNGL
jgi:hypothetical protein